MTIDKKALRSECLAKRELFNDGYRQKASRDIARHLLDAIPQNAKIAAGYRAIRGEIDVGFGLEALFARGHVLCLPVVVDDSPLLFRRYMPGDVLEKGKYNIDVPLPGNPFFLPQAVIVPLVAFDKDGHRLGYGAGYYDRTLSWLKEQDANILIIGAAFSAQEVAYIPSEPHDVKLQKIVTEQGVQSFS